MRCLLPLSCALLLAGPPAAGRSGEAKLEPAPAARPALRLVILPDTTRPRSVVRPDSTQARPVAGLIPDEDDKPTRKSAIRIVGAIALLTITTLLLYNVRSR